MYQQAQALRTRKSALAAKTNGGRLQFSQFSVYQADEKIKFYCVSIKSQLALMWSVCALMVCPINGCSHRCVFDEGFLQLQTSLCSRKAGVFWTSSAGAVARISLATALRWKFSSSQPFSPVNDLTLFPPTRRPAGSWVVISSVIFHIICYRDP